MIAPEMDDPSDKISQLDALMEELTMCLHGIQDAWIPVDAFQQDYSATVEHLCRIFGAAESTPEARSTPKARRERSRAGQRVGGRADPWKRITTLERFEDLTPQIRACLEHSDEDEAAAKMLMMRGVDSVRMIVLAGSTGDAFMARYQWTQHMRRRQEHGNLMLLFGYLFWFDLVQIIRPQCTGRVGGAMLRELRAFLAPIAGDCGLDMEEVVANVNKWSLGGSKVNKLCKRFGDGCVILLHPHLSNNFLESKFTGSGLYHKAAMSNLSRLGIDDHIRDTGVGVLATNVRKLMIRPFSDAYAQRTSRGG